MCLHIHAHAHTHILVHAHLYVYIIRVHVNVFACPPFTYTCVYNTCIHPYIPANTHTHIQIYKRTSIRAAKMHTCMHAHICAHACVCAGMTCRLQGIKRCTYTCTCVCMLAYQNMCTHCKHANSNVHTHCIHTLHASKHALTHAHVCDLHTRIQTCTHTYAHTLSSK